MEMEKKAKKTTKEKLKHSWGNVDSTIRLVKSQKKIEGGELFLKYYENYKKIVWLFINAMIFYNLITGNWLMAFLSFGLFHMHIMVNRNYWELKTLEAYIEENAQESN